MKLRSFFETTGSYHDPGPQRQEGENADTIMVDANPDAAYPLGLTINTIDTGLETQTHSISNSTSEASQHGQKQVEGERHDIGLQSTVAIGQKRSLDLASKKRFNPNTCSPKSIERIAVSHLIDQLKLSIITSRTTTRLWLPWLCWSTPIFLIQRFRAAITMIALT
jgi:hypothetical protein